MADGVGDGTIFQPGPQGSLRPGVRLNDMFEIERLIAEGGMGEVYKGVALASGDPVAIKLVRPEMARLPDVIALFKREAAILHNLPHDAIVRYYVFSIDRELGRAYIAMEYVDGVSLQKRLASGPMAAADVRVLLRRIGGALELAHTNGIVHRDISSDNIILPNGDPRRAKIVDFGIARASRLGEGTIIGDGFAGKYKYVSPEQLGLAGGQVTPKSDIYSFGLVIAEALRGKPIDMGGSQAEVIEKRRKVPDLSDVDISLRPLLTAMLAPNPDDRPANMAEVAAWGETGERTQVFAPPPPPGPAPRRWGGAVAAALVVAALAAGAYVGREQIRGVIEPWIAATPTPTATPTILPPLPPPTAPAATASSAPSPTAATPAPTSSPTPVQAETPSVQALVDQLPPKPAQNEVALGPFNLGADVRVDLPAFADPGGKGLALHATPAPPAGLALRDLGGGRASLEGAASAVGRFGFDVVAVNHNGKSARMKVSLAIASAPPQPAQTLVALEPATVGASYSAGLPPFRSPEKLTLRAERLPEGIAFADLGGGLSQLAGRPAKAGRFSFDIVAATPSGANGRMTVSLEVAAAPAPTATPAPPATTATPGPTAPPALTATPAPTSPAPTATPALTATPAPTSPAASSIASPMPAASPAASPTAPPTPAASPDSTPTAATAPTVAAFLRDFDGGACFAARPAADDTTGARFEAVGADRIAFTRFTAAYGGTFHREPEVRADLIVPAQCPVANLMKQAPASASRPPRLTLDNLGVGKGRPLSGAVTDLGGRQMLLLAIGDDGRAVKVRVQPSPGGDGASFNLPVSGDADSFGKPQLLLAIASDRPLAGLDAFRAGAAADVLGRIGAQWREAGGAAALALFKLVD